MSDRQKISRKKGTTSNQSNPSLKPNIPSLANPSHNLGLESNYTTLKTAQLETSEKQELAVEQIENQENISLKESSKESSKESAFDSINYLQRVNFSPRNSVQRQIIDVLTEIPKQSIQRQELEEEKEENQENSEVIQAKLNASEVTDTDKQEKVSIWHKAFQIQKSEDSKLDKPIESFNYLEKASIFRPKENIQRQELEEAEEENQATSGVIQAKCSECEKEEQEKAEVVQTKLTVGEPGDKYEQEADSLAAKVVEQINSPSSEQTVQGKIEPVVTQVMRQGGVAGGTVNQDVEQNIQQARGSGQGLANNVREPMEQAFGTDFSDVKVHTDGESDVLNRSLNARAFTTGQDIFFKQGEYQPGSKQGQELLAHELTHVVQQSGGLGNQSIQRQQDDNDKNQKIVYLEYSARIPQHYATLDQMYRLFERVAYGREINSSWSCGDFCNMSQNAGKVITFRVPKSKVEINTDPAQKKQWEERKQEYIKLSPSKEKKEITEEVNRRYYQLSGDKPGTQIKNKEEGKKRMWLQQLDQIMREKEHLEKLPPKIKDFLGGSENFKPKDYEILIRISKQLKKLDPKDLALHRLHGMTDSLEQLEKSLDKAASSKGKAVEDPEEMKRLFRVLQDKIADPQFSESGSDSWVRFAKFLERNKDKIEGIIHGKPPGKLTQEKIEKIIIEYGKYIAAEPVETESPEKLETLDDFDKKFKYDPGWQKLSKEDRKLLLEYAKASPEEIKEGKVDFSRVTTNMKISMALKLADTTLLGEMGAAAKAAFTDPTFVITLILIVGVYVGLWLTPEPSGVTKVAAGILTAVLLAQFAWHDIYGFAKAWFTLTEKCSAAKSVDELKNAGNKFLKAIGPIGFDIALAIVMWGAGKAAGPKLSKLGMQRAKARAETAVKTAEAQPGSGAKTPKARAESPKFPEPAETKGKTPTEVLDAFENQLKPGAKNGLSELRGKLGDAKVQKILEGQQNKGLDLDYFLTEKGMTPEARANAKAEVIQAKARLARIKLLELEANVDPALKKTVKKLRTELKKLDRIKDPKQIETKRAEILKELIGEVGEAFGRALLRKEYASKGSNYKVLGNIEAVQEVRGYKSIAEWKADQIKAGKSPKEINTAKLREAQGKLWESLGEADGLVVEKTPSGKLKPIEVEQMKTGMKDTPGKTEAQNTKFMNALKEIAAGNKEVKLFEKTDKAKVGNERTGDFDLSDLSNVKESTHGLPGKGFDKQLFDTRNVLEELAKSILGSGLPSKANPLPLPTTAPRDRDKSGSKQ